MVSIKLQLLEKELETDVERIGPYFLSNQMNVKSYILLG